MASSRKPPQSPDRFQAALERAICEGLEPLRRARINTIAVAFSGGADSTLLLHTSAAFARSCGIRPVALHVHHGLSPNADLWEQACRKTSADLEIEFHVRRVSIERLGGESLEAKAREARYGALAALCEQFQIPIVLTAHHADDQAETLLLNMGRGASIAGLRGIAPVRELGCAFVLRPFLSFSALEIRDALRERGISWIEDESNASRQWRRNEVRQSLLPALKEVFPNALSSLNHLSSLAAQAQVLLDERGSEDLKSMGATAEGFDIAAFRILSRERAANALATWFRVFRGHPPSSGIIYEILGQLFEANAGPRTELVIEGLRFCAEGGRFTCMGKVGSLSTWTPLPSPCPIQWSGEASIEVPQWEGRLVFEPNAAFGLSVDWLRSAHLTLRARTGGERLRILSQRPSRSLKNLYQERGIPVRHRQKLPLLYDGETLIWAAGLGLDVRVQTPGPTALVGLSWESYTRA
ncbi:MAG: tRNA lysidine(34) synthetase TilS [Burkholderiaceae bacterium]|jgi:tRNA(Ile)-lysidine synthase